jgi:hypothetical protein
MRVENYKHIKRFNLGYDPVLKNHVINLQRILTRAVIPKNVTIEIK